MVRVCCLIGKGTHLYDCNKWEVWCTGATGNWGGGGIIPGVWGLALTICWTIGAMRCIGASGSGAAGKVFPGACDLVLACSRGASSCLLGGRSQDGGARLAAVVEFCWLLEPVRPLSTAAFGQQNPASSFCRLASFSTAWA
jgi:hypothetical protein